MLAGFSHTPNGFHFLLDLAPTEPKLFVFAHLYSDHGVG